MAPPSLLTPPPHHQQVLPGWLTTVSLALLLVLITAKTAAKAADLWSKEQRLADAGLRHLAAVDAEGGDMLTSMHTPLLTSLLNAEGGTSGSEVSPPPSPPPRLAFSPPAAHGLRPGSAGSAASSSKTGGGSSGGAPADEETGQAAGSGKGLPARPSSQPLPIGSHHGSAALLLLTPVL